MDNSMHLPMSKMASVTAPKYMKRIYFVMQ